MVSIFKALPSPVLAVWGFVLASQAGMLSIAMTVHGGWVALTENVTLTERTIPVELA